MLRSSRCLLGIMKMLRFCTAGLLRQGGPGQARGAESLISARGARHEARLRASARLGQPWEPQLGPPLLPRRLRGHDCGTCARSARMGHRLDQPVCVCGESTRFRRPRIPGRHPSTPQQGSNCGGRHGRCGGRAAAGNCQPSRSGRWSAGPRVQRVEQLRAEAVTVVPQSQT